MILGKLRYIYYYKIGNQFDQEQLLNRDSLILSDGPIVIENFEIYDQHFIKHFQCLLDYGVIRNVILTGDRKKEYLDHTIKKNFNLEICKNYVSLRTAPPPTHIITFTTPSPNKNTSEKTIVLLTNKKHNTNKTSQENQSSKMDYSF
ncbi:unnamed protein product, partial [Brachionus calyciflorus]